MSVENESVHAVFQPRPHKSVAKARRELSMPSWELITAVWEVKRKAFCLKSYELKLLQVLKAGKIKRHEFCEKTGKTVSWKD